MKLLFCLFNYFPFGGLQKDCLRIAKLCVAKGHEVHILTGEWQGERPEGMQVTVLPVRACSNAGWVKKFAQQAQQYFNTHQTDLIVGFNRIPGIDVYYAADPCYYETYTQLPWYKKLNPRSKIYLQLEQALCAQKNIQFLLLSPRAVAQFAHHYHLSDERMHLLAPSLEKEKYALSNYSAAENQNLKQKYGLKADHKLILFVGSAFKTKGLDRALLALASLPQALQKKLHFWVAGSDDEKPYLSLIKKLSLKVEVKFLQGRDDVPTLMRSADLLLHPARLDNTGGVILEAMASALPVLATDVCGFAPYFVEANAGRVVDSPFKQEQLNQYLLELLTMQQSFEQLRENGLAFCRTHDVYSGIENAAMLIEKMAWDSL